MANLYKGVVFESEEGEVYYFISSGARKPLLVESKYLYPVLGTLYQNGICFIVNIVVAKDSGVDEIATICRHDSSITFSVVQTIGSVSYKSQIQTAYETYAKLIMHQVEDCIEDGNLLFPQDDKGYDLYAAEMLPTISMEDTRYRISIRGSKNKYSGVSDYHNIGSTLLSQINAFTQRDELINTIEIWVIEDTPTNSPIFSAIYVNDGETWRCTFKGFYNNAFMTHILEVLV